MARASVILHRRGAKQHIGNRYALAEIWPRSRRLGLDLETVSRRIDVSSRPRLGSRLVTSRVQELAFLPFLTVASFPHRPSAEKFDESNTGNTILRIMPSSDFRRKEADVT